MRPGASPLFSLRSIRAHSPHHHTSIPDPGTVHDKLFPKREYLTAFKTHSYKLCPKWESLTPFKINTYTKHPGGGSLLPCSPILPNSASPSGPYLQPSLLQFMNGGQP